MRAQVEQPRQGTAVAAPEEPVASTVDAAPSAHTAAHGDYADSVEIHKIGTLPVSKDNVCVAQPKAG